jgi:hypothetical protein
MAGDGMTCKKQIPGGNDRKKSNGNDKGRRQGGSLNAKRAAFAARSCEESVAGEIGLAAEVGCVLFAELFPLLGQVVAAEDRGDRADGNARAAVDALDGIDEKLIVGVSTILVSLGVDTIYRTSVHTRPILRANTGFRNYIRHLNFSLILFELKTSRVFHLF